MKKLIAALVIAVALTSPAVSEDAASCARAGLMAERIAQDRDKGLSMEQTTRMLRDNGMPWFQAMADLIYKEKAHFPEEFGVVVTRSCLKHSKETP